MANHGNTPGKLLVVWGLILLVAAGLVRLAREVPEIHARFELPSNTALYVAVGVGLLLVVVGSLRGGHGG